MATSSFSVLLSISITLFLLLLNKVSSKESTSFTFTKFSPNQKNLILQGDALVPSLTGKLQLTKVNKSKPTYNSRGRALYAAPIQIWDSQTSTVASFTTTFSFVITTPIKAKTADGIAFFLAPVNTQPQKPGGFLGLFSNERSDKSNQIVGVEFDTFTNHWDPKGAHIGIDVNSIKSIKTASWNLTHDIVANVVISYQASTKSLTASLVYPSLETSFIVDAVVDLKDTLPEYVSVGLSASTGDDFETHDVLSWSFHSEFPSKCKLGDDSDFNDAHLSSYVLQDSV